MRWVGAGADVILLDTIIKSYAVLVLGLVILFIEMAESNCGELPFISGEWPLIHPGRISRNLASE
jgi:hypothetical protein